jgi:hypothetical protein
VIEPSKDAYGPDAERSHLADWLELLALAGQPLAEAELADHLRDTNWTVRSRELYHSPEGDAEPSEDQQDGGAGVSPPVEAAGDVVGILESRAYALGDRYPFGFDGRALTAMDPVEEHHRPYLALLAITVAHHYEVDGGHRPERVFEGVVAAVLRARGLVTCDFGAVTRSAADFREAVKVAAHEVRTVPNEEAAPSRECASDEGVDTISHLDWGDLRPGHWLWIGQATLGKSNTWHRKILEPRVAQWRALLGSELDPIGYLAVPHHVEEEQLHYLTSTNARLVLDRLRLCRYLPEVTGPPASVLNAVLRTAVYDPRVT